VPRPRSLMLLAAAGTLLAAGPAGAVPATVDGGSLTWTQTNVYDTTQPAGHDRTWIGYVTNAIGGPGAANGTVAPVAPLTAPALDSSSPRGAAQDYSWVFPATGGSYEADTGTGTVGFDGGLTFASTAHGFKITIDDPQLALNGLSGVLSGSGEYTDGGQIPYSAQPVFNLDLSASSVVLRPDGSREIAGIVPTLAKTGLPFPPNYTGGVSGPDRTPNTFGSFTLKLHTAPVPALSGPPGAPGAPGPAGAPGAPGAPGATVTVRNYVVHLAKAPFRGRGSNAVTLRRSGKVVATGKIRGRVLRVRLRPAVSSLSGRYAINLWSNAKRSTGIVVG